jgi:hypothetical protein
MKGEIYQSDIEFALREIAAGQADELIVTGLGKRRIEADRARQLVADLRAGTLVSAYQPPWPKEWRPPERSAGERPRPAAEKRPHRPKQEKVPFWIWALGIVCLGLVVALVIRGARGSDEDGDSPVEPPIGQTNAPAAPPTGS